MCSGLNQFIKGEVMSVKITILITEKKGGDIRFEAEAAGEQSTGKELRIAEDLKDKLIRLLKDSQPSTKKGTQHVH